MKKLFIFTLLIFYTGSHEAVQQSFMEKIMASAGQSELAHRWNNFFSTGLCLSGEPASREIEELGQEAQKAVGIPAERRVSTRQESLGIEGGGGHAASNAIYVNADYYHHPDVPYGVKRCDMFHEATHIKYHDHAINAFLKSFSFLSGVIGGCYLAKQLKPRGFYNVLYPVVAGSIGYLNGKLTRKWYDRFMERRADREGHYATGCYKCVTEKTEDTHSALEQAHDILQRLQNVEDLNADQRFAKKYAQNFIASKKDYLSVAENEALATELQQQGRLCEVHKL